MSGEQTLLPVDLVIASFNSEALLRDTLVKNLDAGFAHIIIVDGESTDGSCDFVNQIAGSHPGRILFVEAPKRGLANARNIGSRHTSSPYVMHAGPDNILDAHVVNSMLALLRDYSVVSCMTRREEEKGYLSRAHAIYKKRFAPGEFSCVGTPYIAKRELYLSFPFDEAMLNSDDTVFCDDVIQSGGRIYRSNAVCLEAGFDRFQDIVERWLRWGRGDALVYEKNKKDWSFLRRVRSWLHAAEAELVAPFKYTTVSEYIMVFPFLSLCCGLRFFGWWRYAVKKKLYKG